MCGGGGGMEGWGGGGGRWIEALYTRLHCHHHNATEFRSCVKVEVDVLGSPSLISLMVSVDVKQHFSHHSDSA